MEAFLAADTFEVVIDGAHPMRRRFPENLRGACRGRNLPLLRLLRRGPEPGGGWWKCPPPRKPARFLNTRKIRRQRVILTAGSRRLAAYGAVTDQSRLYARGLYLAEEVRGSVPGPGLRRGRRPRGDVHGPLPRS
ncbi:MAG: precorrin-6A/cobalt-precorrin-6A reductase [Oscillospiraceae bacterium]